MLFIDLTFKQLNDRNFDIDFYFNYQKNILTFKKDNKFIVNEIIEQNKIYSENCLNIPNAIQINEPLQQMISEATIPQLL